MTLLEEAIERLRALPEENQESAAAAVLVVVGQHEASYRLTPEQIEEIRRFDAEYDAGRVELLSEEETEAMWRRLGA